MVPKPALMESQGLRRKEGLATTLAWSEVLRDQNEIFDHRLVLDVGFVLNRVPTLAFVFDHVAPILWRSGKLDVVGNNQCAPAQPTLLQNQLQVGQVGVLVVID